MENKNVFEIIETIGKQWPFVLVIFIIIVTIVKWKTIWGAIANLSGVRIKKGETEIEFTNKPKADILLQKNNGIELVKTESLDEQNLGLKDETLSLSECFEKLVEKKIPEAENIFSQIQAKAKPNEIIENEFIFLFYKYINGFATDIDFKEKINDNNITPEQKGLGSKFLGLSYKATKQYAKAIDCFNEALRNTNDESETCKIVVFISQTYLDFNEFEKIEEIIIHYLRIVKEDSNKADLYYQLSKKYEVQKDKILKSITLEKAASLKGNNISYLFDSAYSYSEANINEASLSQYNNLLYIDNNHSTALNNIGVNFQNVNLKLKAVEYYKKSAIEGNSLAAANLAYLYIDAGFDDDARMLFNEFIDKPDVHMNLVNAQAKLLTDKESQQKKTQLLLEVGKNYSKFFNSYGFLYFEHELLADMFSDIWTDSNGHKITVKINNNNLEIFWETMNSKIGDNDVYSIMGRLHNAAGLVSFDFPITKSPESWEILTNKKPYRIIKKFDGFCFLDFDNSRIEILYKSDADYTFLEISK